MPLVSDNVFNKINEILHYAYKTKQVAEIFVPKMLSKKTLIEISEIYKILYQSYEKNL